MQQSLGLDLGVPPGAGAPMFSIGAPQALPAQTNARTAGGAFVSPVTLTTVDASQLLASEYHLVNDGSGWQLTRRLDGFTQTVVDDQVVDGFRIDLGTPPPAATDRFLLQPVTRAANALARVLPIRAASRRPHRSSPRSEAATPAARPWPVSTW
jgi:flagellar hook-associated protein 1 FlgK